MLRRTTSLEMTDPSAGHASTRTASLYQTYPRTVPADATCAAMLKKRTLTNLYNERPGWLAHAHRALDAVVAAAYGWPADLPDDQVLARLLALNLQRAG